MSDTFSQFYLTWNILLQSETVQFKFLLNVLFIYLIWTFLASTLYGRR